MMKNIYRFTNTETGEIVTHGIHSKQGIVRSKPVLTAITKEDHEAYYQLGDTFNGELYWLMRMIPYCPSRKQIQIS